MLGIIYLVCGFGLRNFIVPYLEVLFEVSIKGYRLKSFFEKKIRFETLNCDNFKHF